MKLTIFLYINILYIKLIIVPSAAEFTPRYFLALVEKF